MIQITMPKTVASLIITLATVVAAAPADAGTYDHLDQLALRLQTQSRSLLSEFRLHYRHTQEYRHLMCDGIQMYRLAAHIHDLAHHHGSLHHIKSDLNKLDSLHHHIHDLVDHREIHPHGGHVHGDTGHVHELLLEMEDTLHHMMDDVRELTTPIRHHHYRQQDDYRRGVSVYRGQSGRDGIRIGNSRFSIRLGW